MKLQPIGNDTFEQVTSPIDTMITLTFESILKPQLNIIFNKYKEKSISHNSAQDELNGYIKRCCETVVSNLSNHYRKKLQLFFSKDGLVFYIYTLLMKQSVTILIDKIESLPPA